jgi:hypothetical protein
MVFLLIVIKMISVNLRLLILPVGHVAMARFDRGTSVNTIAGHDRREGPKCAPQNKICPTQGWFASVQRRHFINSGGESCGGVHGRLCRTNWTGVPSLMMRIILPTTFHRPAPTTLYKSYAGLIHPRLSQ